MDAGLDRHRTGARGLATSDAFAAARFVCSDRHNAVGCGGATSSGVDRTVGSAATRFVPGDWCDQPSLAGLGTTNQRAAGLGRIVDNSPLPIPSGLVRDAFTTVELAFARRLHRVLCRSRRVCV